MKGCWILTKVFSASIEIIMHFVFVLVSGNMLCYIYLFTYVEQSLHTWNETDLIVMYFFDMLLNSVCQNFIENFCIYVHERYWPIHVFSHTWKIDPKINIYTKTSMITYTLRCRIWL
jgi:hypothetical protein